MNRVRETTALLLLTAGMCMGAATPTTAPSAADEVKAIFTKYLEALVETRIEEAASLTYVPDEAAKRKTVIYLSALRREKLWDLGLAEALKYKMPDLTLSADEKKQLETVTATIDGDTAHLPFGRDIFRFIREKGVWRVDFLKSMEPHIRGVSEQEWDAVALGVKIQAQIIVDAKAGKFKNGAEAYDELQNRIAAAGAERLVPGVRREMTIKYMTWVKNGLEAFKMELGRYPTTAEGLALVEQRYAFHEVDGWEREFIYSSPGKNGKPYDLSSAGFDGKPGTADDISVDLDADKP